MLPNLMLVLMLVGKTCQRINDAQFGPFIAGVLHIFPTLARLLPHSNLKRAAVRFPGPWGVPKLDPKH